MHKRVHTYIAAAAAAFSLGFAPGSEAAEPVPAAQQIMPAITQAVTMADPSHFTGTAWVRPLFSPTAASNTYGASVTFTPGARTYWHMHSTQQTLIVTEGSGYVQEWGKPVQPVQAGDVVVCPPGVRHWHGAAVHSTMTHIAISEKSSRPVQWFEAAEGE